MHPMGLYNGYTESDDPETYAIIGAAMEVHKELGHGFLEAVYMDALELEFAHRSIPFKREKSITVKYKNNILKSRYKADFFCFDNIIVETKAISKLTGADDAQILNYQKGTKTKKGILLNFGARSLQYKRTIFSEL